MNACPKTARMQRRINKFISEWEEQKNNASKTKMYEITKK